jgi:tight adherence protein C
VEAGWASTLRYCTFGGTSRARSPKRSAGCCTRCSWVARVEAFRHLSERIDLPELRAFVLAMVQADVFGVSISSVLRTQATEIRTKRRQRAEETAMRVPTKLLFPMLFCVLPAMFVVLVGPGVLQVVKSLFQTNIF